MNQNNDKIMKKVRRVRKTRRELIKQNILSGKEHKSHNNKKLIPSRRQCLSFSCKCRCYAKNIIRKLLKIDPVIETSLYNQIKVYLKLDRLPKIHPGIVARKHTI